MGESALKGPIEMPKLIKPERETIPSGSGSIDVYTVEARYAYHDPKVLCGQLFDNRWREVQFQQSPIGVPSKTWPLDYPGYYSFDAAQALRWWFIAQAGASGEGNWCLETRLVRHRAKYSYEFKAEAFVDPRDRSGKIPEDMIEPEGTEQPAQAAA